MANLQLYEYLLQFPLFLGMSRDNLAQVAGHTRFGFQKYQPGQTVARDGDDCKQLFFLLSGTLQIETCSDEKTYRVVENVSAPYMIQPEAIFGYHQRFTHEFSALTESSFITIDKSEVMRLSEEFLVFRLNLLNVFATQTQKKQQITWQPCPKSLRERIIRFFCQHCCSPSGSKTFYILMSQLANEVGDSRLDVSRVLNQLQREGLLLLHRGRTEIPLLECLITSETH